MPFENTFYPEDRLIVTHHSGNLTADEIRGALAGVLAILGEVEEPVVRFIDTLDIEHHTPQLITAIARSKLYDDPRILTTAVAGPTMFIETSLRTVEQFRGRKLFEMFTSREEALDYLRGQLEVSVDVGSTFGLQALARREHAGATDGKLNCWEFLQCGREPGGANASEFGVCSAAADTSLNGINGGVNGGRICWACAGTLCGSEVHGTFAQKQHDCQACNFFMQAQVEESLSEAELFEQAYHLLG
jgi:hypothetical protein